MTAKPSFFLAGIIQGSLPETIHAQDYRSHISGLLKKQFPDSDIFDPFEAHPDSMAYDDETGCKVLKDLVRRAGSSDVVIAFIPEASMGTAIEIWTAHHNGCLVVSVSALTMNWVVRFMSDVVLKDLSELEAFISDGRLEELMAVKN